VDYSQKSSSLGEFRTQAKICVDKWRIDILSAEKSSFLGVKSYEAMRKINRKYVGSGEIFDKLYRHWVVRQYMGILGSRLNSKDIEDSLLQQRLGSKLKRLPHGELLFCPVPLTDFRNRTKRLVEALGGDQ
jgi:hypothetical protein